MPFRSTSPRRRTALFRPRRRRAAALVVVAILAVGAAAAVAAAPARADDAYDKCIDDSDGTNFAWGTCGGEYVAREDAKLNAAWTRLMASATGDTKKALVTEQRAWIAYKELACAFYDSGDWGREGEVLSFPACRAGVIAARTADLERYLGDITQQ